MKTTKDNIEVMLFDYAEGNLSPQERKEVEEFLEKNPQYIEMLNAYKESEPLEKPLGLVFKEKDDLFSLATGKKARKIVFKPSFVYWSSAVAAVVLLFFLVKPLVKNEQTPTATNKELIAENNPKKKFEKAKEKFSNPKKKIKKAKENFTFVIEDEQDSIIHQLAFQKIELPSAEIEQKTKFIKQTYKVEREIIIKETPKFIQKAKGIINFAKNLGEEKLIVVEKEFKVKTIKNV